MERIITSSGAIRNPEKPRVGIVNANSINNCAWEEIHSWENDITYEEWYEDRMQEVREECIREGIPDQDLDETVEALMQNECDRYESDSRTVLFGDWIKVNGLYVIDKNGKNGFAAIYSSYSHIVSVEWSLTTTRCHYTSPCYVMADGSGPCGDLDAPGDSVVAYTLPSDFFPIELKEE